MKMIPYSLLESAVQHKNSFRCFFCKDDRFGHYRVLASTNCHFRQTCCIALTAVFICIQLMYMRIEY